MAYDGKIVLLNINLQLNVKFAEIRSNARDSVSTVSLKELLSQRLLTKFCIEIGGFSRSSNESIRMKSITMS